ncbi:hypothetical protein ACFVU2_18865 [Leifsonia sp. NPDC058194]|uniref:hypothetical protein n=1 Tax=Leifsonia sp. NPDC058194 TaxID=3346374 RepID=UPI0036DC9F25
MTQSDSVKIFDTPQLVNTLNEIAPNLVTPLQVASQSIRYPIEGNAELSAALEPLGQADSAPGNLPAQFFPILDASDLLTKLYIAGEARSRSQAAWDDFVSKGGDNEKVAPDDLAPPVAIPPGVWTKVLSGSDLQIWALVYYGYFTTHGPELVQFRRYSVAPPFYSDGDTNTNGVFTAWMIGTYTEFWFFSATGNQVSWAPGG